MLKCTLPICDATKPALNFVLTEIIRPRRDHEGTACSSAPVSYVHALHSVPEKRDCRPLSNRIIRIGPRHTVIVLGVIVSRVACEVSYE